MSDLSGVVQNFLMGVSWQVGVLFAFIWTISKLSGKGPARWQYLLWSLLLIRLYLPPDLSSPMSLRSLLGYAQGQTIRTVTLAEGEWTFQSGRTVDNSNPSSTANPPAKPDSWNGKLVDLPWLFLLWMGGALFSIFAWVASFRKFRRSIEANQRLPGEIESLWEMLRKEAGRPNAPQPCLIPGDGGPFVAGVLHPEVYLPEEFVARSSPTSLRLALKHELEHLKRRDLIPNLAILVAHILFWFHPLVRIGLRRLQEAREMVIDEKVLASEAEGSNRKYAELVLEVLESRTALPLAAVGMSACSAAGMRERLRRIGRFESTKARLRLIHFVAIVAIAVLLLPLGVSSSTREDDSIGASGGIKKQYPLELPRQNFRGGGADNDSPSTTPRGVVPAQIEVETWLIEQASSSADTSAVNLAAKFKGKPREFLNALLESGANFLKAPKVTVVSGSEARIALASETLNSMNILGATGKGDLLRGLVDFKLNVTPTLLSDNLYDLSIQSDVQYRSGERIVIFDAKGNPIYGPAPIEESETNARNQLQSDQFLLLPAGLKSPQSTELFMAFILRVVEPPSEEEKLQGRRRINDSVEGSAQSASLRQVLLDVEIARIRYKPEEAEEIYDKISKVLGPLEKPEGGGESETELLLFPTTDTDLKDQLLFLNETFDVALRVSPTVLVIDGIEGGIEMVETVPFIAGVLSATRVGNLLSSDQLTFDERDIGTKVRILPKIQADGSVFIDFTASLTWTANQVPVLGPDGKPFQGLERPEFGEDLVETQLTVPEGKGLLLAGELIRPTTASNLEETLIFIRPVVAQ